MAISGARTVGDGISIGDCEVEVNLSGAGYASIHSWATRVTVSGGEIPYSDVRPFDKGAEVYVGAKGSYTVEVEILYTEGSTDPYQNLWDAYEASNDVSCDLRWAPKGSGQGGFSFTTSGGKLTSVSLPQGSGDAEEPNLCVFTIQCGSIARGTES